MWKVIADRSPFYGSINTIYKGKSKFKAWLVSQIHCWKYTYGRALVIKEN